MKKAVLAVVCCLAVSGVWAQDNTSTRMHRRLSRLVFQISQPVQVVMEWQKAVRVRDLLTRPARGRSGSTVVGVKKATTYCGGYYSKSNEISFPLRCMVNEDFKLSRVTLLLPNGKKFLPARKDLRLDKNTIKVRVP